MTIHTLMNTPLVTGQEEPEGIPIPGVQEREDDDEVCSFPARLFSSVPCPFESNKGGTVQ